ncbi:Ionotropic receptor 141 [Diabrotica virgifera virgifera]|nr:Ionotropic receptor 141 [Diabrotica virgifera virgifera]
MLLLFLLSSGALYIEAYISITYNLNILEDCINELLDFVNQDRKFLYLVNTNIRLIKYSAVLYGESREINKISTMSPDIFVASGNVSEVINVLYKLNILYNLKYFIFNVQQLDQDILSILEQYFISKAIFIQLNTKKEYYDIYTMTSGSYQLIDKCPTQKANKQKIKSKLNKLFIKKFGYLNVLYAIDEPFVISSSEGIHIELLNMISKNINVKLNFMKAKERNIVIDVTPEFIDNRSYDVYGSLFSSTRSIQSYAFDETIRITEDKLVYITPNILVTNNWTIFYGEFANSVWTYFVLLLLTLSVVISITDYLVPEKKNINIVPFLLTVLFEGAVTIYSKKWSVKIIFINYLIFVLIFTTIYKSQMFNIMRKDNAYNPIKNRIDLLKYKFKMCFGSQIIIDSYKSSKDPVEHYFGCQSEVILNTENYWECINMTAFEKNTVSFLILKRLEYDGPQVYLDEHGVPLLNILTKDFHSYLYFAIPFRKGHPLFNIFNDKLTILKEAGFVEYQYKVYQLKFERAVAAAQKKSTLYFKVLELNALQSVFFVYIALISVSSLVFGLELALHKKR